MGEGHAMEGRKEGKYKGVLVNAIIYSSSGESLRLSGGVIVCCSITITGLLGHLYASNAMWESFCEKN